MNQQRVEFKIERLPSDEILANELLSIKTKLETTYNGYLNLTNGFISFVLPPTIDGGTEHYGSIEAIYCKILNYL